MSLVMFQPLNCASVQFPASPESLRPAALQQPPGILARPTGQLLRAHGTKPCNGNENGNLSPVLFLGTSFAFIPFSHTLLRISLLLSSYVVWPLFNSLQAFWPGLQVRAFWSGGSSFCMLGVTLAFQVCSVQFPIVFGISSPSRSRTASRRFGSAFRSGLFDTGRKCVYCLPIQSCLIF